jgi:hypothetical protein
LTVPAATSALLQEAFIWLDETATEPGGYVAFRRVVTLPLAPVRAELHVFADTRYVLWVNGEYVDRGPCRFDPAQPEYDSFELTGRLTTGTHVLAVLAHHYHDGRADDDPTPLNGRVRRHRPGLTLCLTLTHADGHESQWRTDTTWKAAALASHAATAASWGAIPDAIDARLEPAGWTQADFDDSSWLAPRRIPGGRWGRLRPRALPQLRETPVPPRRAWRAVGSVAAPPQPAENLWPVRLAAGESLWLDLGRGVLGYDVVDLEAAAGAELEVAHGHGYIDDRLDEVYLTNRYTTRPGRQLYRSGDCVGCQYLQLHVRSGAVVLHGVQVIHRAYPFDRLGRFACSDPFLEELWQRSLNTVELCSEDGYTDCGGRERAEWMGDAAVCEYPVTRVALAGPATVGQPRRGDPRLLRNMLRHIAASQQADGRLKAHHPTDRWDIHGFIDDYACLWVQCLRQYYDDTGDALLVEELWPALERQLLWFLARRTARGLVLGREFVFVDNPCCYHYGEGATLNAALAAACGHAAALAAVLARADAATRYSGAAAELAAAMDTHLWDAEAGAIRSGWFADGPGAPSVHAGVLALYHGVVRPARRDRLWQWLTHRWDEIDSPYSAHFLLQVLYDEGTPDTDREALAYMRRKWAPVLARRDHDTVTEGFGPHSLCHNIGATAAFYLSSRVLGVERQGGLAARTVCLEPHLGDLAQASGTVLTEFGPVHVDYERLPAHPDLACRCELPAGVTGVLRLPADHAGQRVRVNGRETTGSFVADRGGRLDIHLPAGRHQVQVHAEPVPPNP